MNSYVRNIRTLKWLLPIYVLVSVTAVFYVPYLFAVQPAASPSYYFGYNNRLGVLLLLTLVAFGSIWTREINYSFVDTVNHSKSSQKALVLALTAVSIACLFMFAIAGRQGGFLESSYDIDRTWLLLQGKVPYVDFEWPFGVIFLYIPVSLCRTLSISPMVACALTWALGTLAGVWMLFAVVNAIDYHTTKRTAIFILVLGGSILGIVFMGVHSSLVRYTLPLVFILRVHRVISSNRSNRITRALVLCLMLTGALLLVSPEIAISHGFACAVLFLLDIRISTVRRLMLFFLLITAFGLIFSIAGWFHVLDTMRSSSSGADSMPIVPAPFILAYFAGLFLCAAYVRHRFVRAQVRDNTIALIVYSLPMTTAALGRCGLYHVFANGLGILVPSLFYVSNHPRTWRWVQIAFVLIFIVLIPVYTYGPLITQLTVVTLYANGDGPVGRFFQGQINEHLSPQKRASLERSRQQFAVPNNVDPSKTYMTWHGTFAAPFGFRPNTIGTSLTDVVDYGYYEGLENANTPNAIHRKIDELVHNPQRALLLPAHFDRLCTVDVALEQSKLSSYFGFPYSHAAAHPDSVRAPLCAYIHSRYILAEEASPSNYRYELWKPKEPSR
jgi:hypothetical protein